MSVVIALAINRYLDAEALRRLLLNALPRPDKGVEYSYLEELEQAIGKTPALLAASEAADLRLFEAFSPLTLRADQEDGAPPDPKWLSVAERDRRVLEELSQLQQPAPPPRLRPAPPPRLRSCLKRPVR